MSDRAALEAEKEQLVNEMADMQKQFMGGLFEGPFDARKYFATQEMKDFKARYHEKALRVSQIANALLKA